MENRVAPHLNGRPPGPPRRVDWIAFSVVTRHVALQWAVLAVTCAAAITAAVCAWNASTWAKSAAESAAWRK